MINPTGTTTLTLPTQAFPHSGHPGVLVHVPPGVEDDDPRVTVYFHGHNTNITRMASLLAAFDLATKPSVLVIPQLRWSEANGDAGALGKVNGLRTLLADVLAQTPGLADWTTTVLEATVMAHSGGYVAAAAAVRHGGVFIGDVGLFDSLYGYTADFARFASDHATKRFVNLYGESTRAQSEVLARVLGESMPAGTTVLDKVGATGLAIVGAARAATVRTHIAHSDIPKTCIAAMQDLLRG